MLNQLLVVVITHQNQHLNRITLFPEKVLSPKGEPALVVMEVKYYQHGKREHTNFANFMLKVLRLR